MLLALLTLPPAHAAAPAEAPVDARFAVALWCDPTCDDSVFKALDAGLAAVDVVDALPSADSVRRPTRVMGLTQAGGLLSPPSVDAQAALAAQVDRPAALAASKEAILVWFAAPAGQGRAVLGNAHQALKVAAETAHGWVEDLDTQRIHDAGSWAALDPRGPATDWFVVDAAPAGDDGASLRLVTRGLRRFGTPELVSEGVRPELGADVAQALNATALTLVARRTLAIPAKVSVNTGGAKGTATLVRVPAQADDPEGPLLSVRFTGAVVPPEEPYVAIEAPEAMVPTAPAPPAPPDAPTAPVAPTPPAPPEAPRAPVARAPQGPRPQSPASVPPGPGARARSHAPPASTLDEARADAAQALRTHVRDAFAKGLPRGDSLSVKAPWPTPAGGVEYMWVTVERWEGERLVGTLANAPWEAEGVRKGDRVTVAVDDVFDYLWRHADGTREGNTTEPFLR